MKQDPESLERDNDIAIDHMGDRVAMLRKITSGDPRRSRVPPPVAG